MSLLSLIAVVMVMSSAVLGAGMLLKAYREGGTAPAACVAACLSTGLRPANS